MSDSDDGTKEVLVDKIEFDERDKRFNKSSVNNAQHLDVDNFIEANNKNLGSAVDSDA